MRLRATFLAVLTVYTGVLPLFLSIPLQASAAEAYDNKPAPCIDPRLTPPEAAQDVIEPPIEADQGEDALPFTISISKAEVVATNPLVTEGFFDAFVLENGGWQNADDTDLWHFCGTVDLDPILNPAPISAASLDSLAALSSSRRLAFRNPLDRWALIGEPCRKFVGEVCDETKEPREVAQPDGSTKTVDTPLYYDDIAWTNGRWDAPKADRRLVEYLVYLVTPAEQGGAGREYIRVDRILQQSESNREFASVAVDPSDPLPERAEIDSAHSYDLRNPSKPTKLADAVDISEIDFVRMTIKTRRCQGIIRSCSTSYDFKQIPLKVSYQTNEGASKAPNVAEEFLSGARSSFSSALAGIIDPNDLPEGVSLEDFQVSDLGELGTMLAWQALTDALGVSGISPVEGMDETDFLEIMGRRYLAKNLGLPEDIFDDSSSPGAVVRATGQGSVERALGLPDRSLDGATSQQVLENLGRRVLEESLQIAPGSLPSGTVNREALLERVGEGALARTLSIPLSVAQQTSWQTLSQNTEFQSQIFAEVGTRTDERLRLMFQSDGSTSGNRDGFTAQDFANPTSTLLSGANDAALAKYKRLVGSRALSTGLERFSSQQSDAAPVSTVFADPVDTVIALLGLTSTTETSGQHFITLQNLAFDTSATTQMLLDRNLMTSEELTKLGQLIRTQQPGIYPGSSFRSTYKSLLSNDPRCFGIGTTGFFGIGGVPCTYDPSLESVVGRINLLSNQWLPIVQSILARVQSEQEKPQVRSSGNRELGTKLEQMRKQASETVGAIQSQLDSLASIVASNGQSAQAAAIGMPAQYLQRIGDRYELVAAQDPVTSALQGSLTPETLRRIGATRLARSTTEDKLAQLTLISYLQQPTLDPEFRLLSNLGVNESRWKDLGFATGDFDRIFAQNLSQSTFDRIGSSLLIEHVWEGKQKQDSSSYGILRDLAGSQDSSFYRQRLVRVREAAETLRGIGSRNGTLTDQLRASLDALDALQLNTGGSIREIRETIDKYEAIAGILSALDPEVGRQLSRLTGSSTESQAGRTLTLSDIATVAGASLGEGCLSRTALQGALKGSGTTLTSSLNTFTGCILEDSLNLPFGSVQSWLESPDKTYFSLTQAIGEALIRERRGSGVAYEVGSNYLMQALAGKLGDIVPTLSFGTVSLDLTDVQNLLAGNLTMPLEKIGGSYLDQLLNLPIGSGAALITPRCYEDGEERACTAAESTQQRLVTLANLGLQRLGVDLGLPTNFNLLNPDIGDRTFLANLAIGQLGRVLGLDTDNLPNSFDQLLSTSQASRLAMSFGLGSELATLVRSASQDLRKRAGMGGSAEEIAEALRLADSLDAFQERVAQRQFDTYAAGGSYWTPGVVADGSALLANERSLFQELASSEGAALLAVTAILSPGSAATLLSGVLREVTSQEFWDEKGAGYQLVADIAKQRASSLASQFGIEQDLVRQWIDGNVTNEAFARQAADRYLRTTLVNQLENLVDTQFGDLATRFNITAEALGCEGYTISAMLGLSRPTSGPFEDNSNSSCELSEQSLKNLLSDTSENGIRRKGLLFDAFLGTAFTNTIEDDLQIDRGTIRALVLQPQRAKEVALDQGIRMVADTVFGMSGVGEDNKRFNVQQSLKRALLAGSCPVDVRDGNGDERGRAIQGTCTYQFDQDRALNSLRNDLASYAQEFLPGMSAGEVIRCGEHPAQCAQYAGLAQLVKSLNSEVLSGPGSEAFIISFEDLRLAYGPAGLTTAAAEALVERQQAAAIRSYYLGNNSAGGSDAFAYAPDPLSAPVNLLSMSDAELVAYFASDDTTLDPLDRERILSGIADDTVNDKELAKQLRQRAQESLRYQVYDALAFQVDPSIPKGFAAALFGKDAQARGLMLAQYTINKLNLGETVFGGYLSDEQVSLLIAFATDGFQTTDPQRELAVQSALVSLDRWFSREGSSLFGVELPPGIAVSLFAWGKTGFDPKLFNSSENLTIAGASVPSVGGLLRSYGEQQLFAWGDKLLGLPAGGAYQLYSATQQVIQATEALKVAHAVSGIAFVNGSSASSYVASARASLTAAQANLAATVINLAFGAQIAGFEAALGLAAGSGALAVTMLTQLAFGVPVDPITLGLFIGLNLFFGFASVSVTVTATADGYFPKCEGDGRCTKKLASSRFSNYPTSDPPLGEFNAKDAEPYRAGLMKAATGKIRGLLDDTARFAEVWGPVRNIDPLDLWVGQVYTYSSEDVTTVEHLIGRPAPWDSPFGYGYGALSQRSVLTTEPDGTVTAEPVTGYNAGFFGDPVFRNHLHVRW